MEFIQGSTYDLELNIRDDGVPVNVEDIKTIVLQVGDIIKTYENGGIDYNQEIRQFIAHFTQEDTMTLSGKVKIQLKVLFNDNRACATLVQDGYVYESIILEVLK